MPDDKPSENPENEQPGQESEKLSADAEKAQSPADKPTADGDLQKRGLLPDARIEVAPGVAVGDSVKHSNESWIAKGSHEGKALIYQQGRGLAFAGVFNPLDGKPDPAVYKELPPFDGQIKGVTYYADKKGSVFKVQEVYGQKLMSSAHDLKLVDPAEIAKSTPEEKPRTQTAEPPKAEAKPEPKVGELVDYNNEKLKVGAVKDGQALLYLEGRRIDWAISPTAVSDAELKRNFKAVDVMVGDEKVTRYVSKDSRDTSVYFLDENRGNKALYRDNSMEAVRLSDIGKGKITVPLPNLGPEVSGSERRREARAEARPEPKTAVIDQSKLPKVGEQVRFGSEKLNLLAYDSNHAILHKTGRNLDYAVSGEHLSNDEFERKYQQVDLIIDGNKESRYIEKGHPERGVYLASDFGGQKSVYQDHSFEVVPNKDLLSPKDRAALPRPGNDLPANPEATPDAGAAKETAKDRPPVAEQRIGKMGGEKAIERVAVVDGQEIKIRTPTSYESDFKREVEIHGNKIQLHQTIGQQWFYSETNYDVPRDGSAEQVKLHVTGIDAKDVAKLQAELLPFLEKLREDGHLQKYKTFDPNFMDGAWHDHPDRVGKPAGPKGNDSKAFTIYLPQSKAEDVAKLIDKFLAEKKLTLENFAGDNVAELTRNQSQSKRVSIERDMWEKTVSVGGREGAVLDPALVKELHDKFGSHGITDGKLGSDALRAAEKAAGIKSGQLTYDREGRLMFADANPKSEKHPENRFYLDESKANKTEGAKTGRPAIYALYEMTNLDPAKIHLDAVREQKRLAAEAAQPERVAPKAESLQGTETRVASDGTLDRRDARPGEVLAREQLERRDRVDAKEIEALRSRAEELAKSDKAADREKAEAMRNAVDALEGRLGKAAQEMAHKTMLAESRKALERGEGGGYGKAVVGGLIGIGILTTAALACYRSSMKAKEQEAIERAKVR
ncbi:MAG: hypothetical protein K2X27_11635 [Candidatus Obscuribacterales bacterium]|nr:hypothetical protein [Candidatus Obscuribacterales bacterium]